MSSDFCKAYSSLKQNQDSLKAFAFTVPSAWSTALPSLQTVLKRHLTGGVFPDRPHLKFHLLDLLVLTLCGSPCSLPVRCTNLPRTGHTIACSVEHSLVTRSTMQRSHIRSVPCVSNPRTAPGAHTKCSINMRRMNKCKRRSAFVIS